ncbi:MAG TPA: hypothetical protein ENO01_03475 [Candidatus Marinimicrobia bacterium]|nr:hypothetical protein [Candidatus Neomarinimicrobiota bacterium]
MKTVRFGGIDFINSYPLIKPASGNLKPVELFQDSPSVLYEKLLARELDAAMIPTYSMLSGPISKISGEFVIGSDGPVMTVCLYCRSLLKDGIHIALDSKSRTSVQMLKILLLMKGYGNISYEFLSFDQIRQRTDIDAFLLIGDDTFHRDMPAYSTKTDVGQLWKEMIGTPFVYAVTAARDKKMLNEVNIFLQKNYNLFNENKNIWLEKWSSETGIDYGILEKYLTQSICHKMNPGSVETGVRTFQKYCVKYGLLKEEKAFQIQV